MKPESSGEVGDGEYDMIKLEVEELVSNVCDVWLPVLGTYPAGAKVVDSLTDGDAVAMADPWVSVNVIAASVVDET